MMRRTIATLVIVSLALLASGCGRKKVANPIANLDSKQPDKVLYDRAIDLLRHSKYDQARTTLQVLINTYPDSEFIARAKLTIADAWYQEGNTTALGQAEIEYKDFQAFFPNMPEAAEAQMKVAGIHYRQMQKPDRDFTHARRAEDEYRQMVQQYPDSKLVPEAKARLREVQEVLADREFRIGRFYYLRESFPASIARLKSLADEYPLYSGADEALFLLGQSYEGEIEIIRSRSGEEATKARLLNEFSRRAADAYGRVITQYPATDRRKDAEERLTALKQPVPTPTPEAMAASKELEASRGKTGTFGKVMGNFRSRPDLSLAASKGDPVLVDAKPTFATEVLSDVQKILAPPPKPQADAAENSASGTVLTGKDADLLKANQPAPRSDDADKPAPAPAQTNDLGDNPKDAAPADASSSKGGKAADTKADKKSESTSKKKKKKGLGKLIPF